MTEEELYKAIDDLVAEGVLTISKYRKKQSYATYTAKISDDPDDSPYISEDGFFSTEAMDGGIDTWILGTFKLDDVLDYNLGLVNNITTCNSGLYRAANMTVAEFKEFIRRQNNNLTRMAREFEKQKLVYKIKKL